MVLLLRCTKSLIDTLNKKGYKIDRKPRRKPAVLPVNKVPEQAVTDKVPRKENHHKSKQQFKKILLIKKN